MAPMSIGALMETWSKRSFPVKGRAARGVRGQLSPPGHYCNLGASKYMLKVYKILKVTDKRAEDK